MFILKKIMIFLFYPLVLGLLLQAAGIFYFFRKKFKTGTGLMVAGFILLLMFSYKPVMDPLFSTYESSYPVLFEPEKLKGIEWVVVLGGGVTPDERLTPAGQLSLSSLSRLTEGLRILRRLPSARLLVSGGRVFNRVSEAEIMKKAAMDMGAEEKQIVLEEESKDTKDQAEMLKKSLGTKPFILITSAFHMKRAMTLFEKQGMQAIAAPADFQIKRKDLIDPGTFFPSPESLSRAQRFLKEMLALFLMKVF